MTFCEDSEKHISEVPAMRMRLEMEAPETLVMPIRDQFMDQLAYDDAVDLFERLGHWAQPKECDGKKPLDLGPVTSQNPSCEERIKELNCYQKCQAADKEKLKECQRLNKEHEARMKELGCGGTRCTTPSIARSCS